MNNTTCNCGHAESVHLPWEAKHPCAMGDCACLDFDDHEPTKPDHDAALPMSALVFFRR